MYRMVMGAEHWTKEAKLPTDGKFGSEGSRIAPDFN
jgi:hypothetical protein